jgi:hypothetical protein
VATIIYYAPQAIRVRISYFALPSEVSLDQADHVSSKEPAYSTRADSAMPALLLIKLISLVRSISRRWLVSAFLVFSVRRVKVMPMLKA